MDFRYQPPDNETHCLHEKSFKDELPVRKCNMESTLWFMLKCPKYFESYKNILSLQSHYDEYYEENSLEDAKQQHNEWVPTPNRDEKLLEDDEDDE